MTDTALYTRCQGLFHRIRWRLSSRVFIPHADWEDIQARAIVRVFDQRGRLDPMRPVGPWAFTVMWRATMNELRSILPPKREERGHYVRPLSKLMRPLQTRVRQLNQWGEYAVVIEPDIVDDPPRPAFAPDLLDEFATTLQSSDRILLSCAREATTVSAIARRLRKPYPTVHSRLQRLGREYRAYIALDKAV